MAICGSGFWIDGWDGRGEVDDGVEWMMVWIIDDWWWSLLGWWVLLGLVRSRSGECLCGFELRAPKSAEYLEIAP